MLDHSDCRTFAMNMPWIFASLLREVRRPSFEIQNPLKVEHLQESQ